MRVTSKGQVTIPVTLRERKGLLPNSEVEIIDDGKDGVRILRSRKKSNAKTRGEKIVDHLVRFGRAHPINMTTDEIMALTRGED